MGKLDIKESRAGWRDPRADETEPPRPGGSPLLSPPVRAPAPAAAHAASRVPGSPSELMKELSLGLSLDLPPPPPSSAGMTGEELPISQTGDPFGVVGTTIGDVFEIENVVAHGGFGVIYRAKHLRFSAPVAIKCLKIPNNLSHEEREQFLARFKKEGEVMFRLSGTIPEVVRPIHLDGMKLQDGRLVPYIAMEWLEGETLKDVIVRRLSEGKRPLTLLNAVALLSPVARALSRAHHFPSQAGPLCILHCDLKPDNIFVTNVDSGQILKVFDFGIAKVRSAATRQVGGFTAETSANMFTPAYAAPEQWTPDRYGQTGPWTDVFALALTLTELVTQKPAIDGAPTAMLSQCVDEKKRPTPRRLGLAVSDRVEGVFVKALAVDPKNRHQSVERFWSELEDALELPHSFGGGGRQSLAGVAMQLPSSWDEEAAPSQFQARPGSQPPAVAASAGPTPAFGGELDFGLAAPPPAPLAAPAPAAMAAPAPIAMAAPNLGLSMELAGPAGAPPVAASQPAPMTPSTYVPESLAQQSLGLGGAIDLADERPPPAPIGTPQAGVPAAPSSFQGFQMGPHPDEGVVVGPTAGSIAKEKLSAAANKAGQVAVVAASSAASAAKNMAVRAFEVNTLPKIQIDQPATWLRPMRGPIIALCAAVGITIIAVIVNKATASNFKVSWISLPLMLGAIGFAVFRWVKLTSQ